MRKSLGSAQFFCASYPTPAKVFGKFTLSALLLIGAASVEPSVVRAQPRCDYEGPSGICVRADSDAMRFNLSVLEGAYVQAKRDIEARYLLDLSGVPGPIVRVMNVASFARLHTIRSRLDGDQGGHHGWTAFASGEIRITGPLVMRHEAIHYLLLKVGYPNRLNAMHEHPAFDEYRNGNWLPKRASPPLQQPVSQQSQSDSAALLPKPSSAPSATSTSRTPSPEEET